MKYKERSQRQLRVGEQIRQVLTQAIRSGHFHEEELRGIETVTVNEVRISPDLKNATAFVMSLCGQEVEVLVKEMNARAYYFQKYVASELPTKNTPKIKFEIDSTVGEVDHIEELLRKARGEYSE